MGIHECGGAFQIRSIRALFIFALTTIAAGTRAQMSIPFGHMQQSAPFAGAMPSVDARFEAPQDLRQIQTNNYSFQNVYQNEGLNQNPALAYQQDASVAQDLKDQIELAVGHLGCANFPDIITMLGPMLRGGVGAFGNNPQQARMFFFSEIRNSLKMRFNDNDGAGIRSRIEEGFLLTMDSAASLDFSNPESQIFVSQLALSLASQYQNYISSKGLVKYGCGLTYKKIPAPEEREARSTQVQKTKVAAESTRSQRLSRSSRRRADEDRDDLRSRRLRTRSSRHERSSDLAEEKVEEQKEVVATDLAAVVPDTPAPTPAIVSVPPVNQLIGAVDASPVVNPVTTLDQSPLSIVASPAATVQREITHTARLTPVVQRVPAAPTQVIAPVQVTQPAQAVVPVPASRPTVTPARTPAARPGPERRLLNPILVDDSSVTPTQSTQHSTTAPRPSPRPTPAPTRAAVSKPSSSTATQNSFVEQGVPRDALEEALQSYESHKRAGRVRAPRNVVVMDLTRKSSQKRFWVLDMTTGEVLRSSYVGHGSGNGLGASNPQDEVAYVSDKPGSNASTWGAMLIEGPDRSSSLPNATRLEGLDSHNRNMGRNQREIKIHSADYFTRPGGSSINRAPSNAGRSSGCPVLYPEDASWLRTQVPAGSFMYSFKGDIPVVNDSVAARRAVREL